MGIYGSPNWDTGNKTNEEFYKCKKCGNEYFKDWGRCPICKTPKGKGKVRPIFIYLLVFLSVGLIMSLSNPNVINNIIKNIPASKNTIPETNNDFIAPKEEIPINLEPINPPQTGIYQLYTEDALVAPFQTKNHQDDKYYFMKFKSTETNKTVLTVFLNKNENCDLKVPLGTYEITYASGNNWYGEQELFGPSTQYQKYNNIYNFYIDTANQNYRGYYIDMTPSLAGNLTSDYIDKDNF